VICKTGFGLDDWICCTLNIPTVRDYRQYSAIAILHTSQFTVTHALGFSVFTSRILATDLSQSHCNFKSHMKSSCHSLIPFLPFLQLPIPKTRLDSTQLDSTTLDYCSTLRRVFRLCPFIIPSTDHTENTDFIVKEGGLLVRCLITDVLLSHACASRECVYQAVACQ
jgi:hypothetical protein